MRSQHSLTFGIVIALLVAACGGTTSGPSTTQAGQTAQQTQAAQKPYLLGYNADLSSTFLSPLSKPHLAGLKTYIEYFNKQGGVKGRKIQIEVLDDRADAATGSANYGELVEKGVFAVSGNISSAVWTTVGPLAERQRVPQIGMAGIEDFFNPVRPWLFLGWWRVGAAATVQVQSVKQIVPSAKRVAIFRYSTPAIESWNKIAMAETAKAGYALVANETVPATATDATAQAATIAAAKPDVVVATLTDALAPIVIQALRAQGVRVPVIGVFAEAPATLERVKDDQYYVFWGAQPPNAKNVDAVSKMREHATQANQVDQMTTNWFTFGYLQGVAITEALKICKDPCNGPAFRDALEGLSNVQTNDLSGTLGASASDHALMTSMKRFRWKDGAIISEGSWVKPQ